MNKTRCRRCGGPVRLYAGDTHQWTCQACLADYINRQRTPRTKARARTAHNERKTP